MTTDKRQQAIEAAKAAFNYRFDDTSGDSHIPALEDAIEAYERVMGDGWLPIENAPRDGTWCLLYTGKAQSPNFMTAFWTGKDWCWELVDGGPCGDVETDAVTHWMPLPQPPKQGGETA